MQITPRPAIAEDFAYCKRRYFTEMKRIIEELNLDPAAQEVGFEQQWELVQVRIIMLNGSEVGWWQSVMQGEGLFIGQLFVDGPFQRRGGHQGVGWCSRSCQSGRATERCENQSRVATL